MRRVKVGLIQVVKSDLEPAAIRSLSSNLFPYPRPPPGLFQTQANSHDAARMNIIETSAESKPSPTRKTEITLPGNLAPYSESSIYARTNGYLKAWKTDLGAKVAAGQLMAEISAPDVDAQSNQATANLAQAQANQTIVNSILIASRIS